MAESNKLVLELGADTTKVAKALDEIITKLKALGEAAAKLPAALQKGLSGEGIANIGKKVEEGAKKAAETIEKAGEALKDGVESVQQTVEALSGPLVGSKPFSFARENLDNLRKELTDYQKELYDLNVRGPKDIPRGSIRNKASLQDQHEEAIRLDAEFNKRREAFVKKAQGDAIEINKRFDAAQEAAAKRKYEKDFAELEKLERQKEAKYERDFKELERLEKAEERKAKRSADRQARAIAENLKMDREAVALEQRREEGRLASIRKADAARRASVGRTLRREAGTEEEVEAVRGRLGELPRAEQTAAEAKKILNAVREERNRSLREALNASSVYNAELAKARSQLLADEKKAADEAVRIKKDEIARKNQLEAASFRVSAIRLEQQAKRTQAFFENTLQNAARSAAAFAQRGVSVLAGGGFEEQVGKAAKYEESLANIGSLLRQGDAPLQNFDAGLKAIAKTTSKDLVDLTEGLYDAISSGIPATNGGADALNFLNQAQKAAVAGLGSTKDAVQVGATILNTYGKSAGSVETIFNKLFETVNIGVIRFPELSASLGQVVGIAQKAGVAFDELLGAIATITKSGTPAAEAVSGLRQVIQAFLSPTVQAKKVAKQFGITLGAKALRDKGFTGLLDEINAKIGNNAAALDKIIPRVEGFRDVLSLLRKNASGYKADTESIANGTDALNRAFGVQSQTISAQVGVLRNNVSVFVSGIVSQLGPDLLDLFSTIKNQIATFDGRGVTGFFSSLIVFVKQTIEGTSSLGLVLQGAFQGVGTLLAGRFITGGFIEITTAITQARDALNVYRLTAKAAAGETATFGQRLSALALTASGIAGGIGAIVTAVVAAIPFLTKLGEAIGEVAAAQERLNAAKSAGIALQARENIGPSEDTAQIEFAEKNALRLLDKLDAAQRALLLAQQKRIIAQREALKNDKAAYDAKTRELAIIKAQLDLNRRFDVEKFGVTAREAEIADEKKRLLAERELVFAQKAVADNVLEQIENKQKQSALADVLLNDASATVEALSIGNRSALKKEAADTKNAADEAIRLQNALDRINIRLGKISTAGNVVAATEEGFLRLAKSVGTVDDKIDDKGVVGGERSPGVAPVPETGEIERKSDAARRKQIEDSTEALRKQFSLAREQQQTTISNLKDTEALRDKQLRETTSKALAASNAIRDAELKRISEVAEESRTQAATTLKEEEANLKAAAEAIRINLQNLEKEAAQERDKDRKQVLDVRIAKDKAAAEEVARRERTLLFDYDDVRAEINDRERIDREAAIAEEKKRRLEVVEAEKDARKRAADKGADQYANIASAAASAITGNVGPAISLVFSEATDELKKGISEALLQGDTFGAALKAGAIGALAVVEATVQRIVSFIGDFIDIAGSIGKKQIDEAAKAAKEALRSLQAAQERVGEARQGSAEAERNLRAENIRRFGTRAERRALRREERARERSAPLEEAAKQVADAAKAQKEASEALAEARKEQQEAAAKAADPLGFALKERADEINAVFSNLAKNLPKVLGEFVPQFFKDFAKMFAQEGPKILVAIIKSLPAVVNALVDAIPVIIDGFIKALPEIINALIAAAPSVLLRISNLLPEIAVRTAWSFLKALTSGEFLNRLAEGIGDGLVEGISTAYKTFFENEFVKQFFDAVSEVFDKLWAIWVEAFNGFIENIKGAFIGLLLGGLSGALHGILVSIFSDSIVAAFEAVGDFITQNFGEVVLGAMAGIPGLLIAGLGKLLNEFFPGLLDTLAESIFGTLAEKIGGAVEYFYTELPKVLFNIHKDIAVFFVTALKDVFLYVGEKLFEVIDGAFMYVIDKIAAFFDELFVDFETLVTRLMSMLTGGASDAVGKFAKGDIFGGVKDLPLIGGVVGAGEKLASGDVIGAATDTAKSIVDPFGIFASGGYLPGAPTQPIPIVAHGGEGILNAKATKMLGGKQVIDYLNAGGNFAKAFSMMSDNASNLGNTIAGNISSSFANMASQAAAPNSLQPAFAGAAQASPAQVAITFQARTGADFAIQNLVERAVVARVRQQGGTTVQKARDVASKTVRNLPRSRANIGR